MRAFRGSLVAGLSLLVLWGGLSWFEKGAQPGADGSYVKSEAESLFRFEKEEVVRIEIRRPEDTLVLSDSSDGWIVEPDGFTASRSMVSRVKHQLHDLDARARVVADPESLALYGLGDRAVEVNVSKRNGEVIRFAAGDPNPSSVSYYIRPLPGDIVYTVKKSAVDFYSFTADSFRETRFAVIDGRDAVRVQADLPGAKRLVLQRQGEDAWVMQEPEEMEIERDRVRSLLGRVGALKAKSFVQEIPEDNASELALYGLDEPRAEIVVSFGSRDPLSLLVGKPFSDKPDEELAYMKVAGSTTIYTAKDDLLEDFARPSTDFRRRSFVSMSAEDVREMTISLSSDGGFDFSGEVTLRFDSGKWKWEDGRPVPGSTPRRVADRLTGIRANEFVDNAQQLAQAGFDAPLAKVDLFSEDGEQATVLIGGRGPDLVPPRDSSDREAEALPPGAPPRMEPEVMQRYYAKLEGLNQVYLIDPGPLGVLEDAVREFSRKEDRDAQQKERRDLIELELERE